MKAIERAFAYGLLLGYLGLIYFLSSRPSIPIPPLFPHQDKLFHFCEYLGLAFLAAHALPRTLPYRRRFGLAVILAAVYALSDEWHQSFVPGRDASGGDWLADTLGGWAGAYVYLRGETRVRNWDRT